MCDLQKMKEPGSFPELQLERLGKKQGWQVGPRSEWFPRNPEADWKEVVVYL